MSGKTTEILKYESPCGKPLFFPLATINGDRSGPRITITAGLHGCEYPGIIAAIRLFKNLTPKNVSGCIKIITITSVAAFEERSMFITPFDKINPNRVFPGRPDGSYSEFLTYKVMKLIEGSNYYIDLHGGDMVEELDPFSIYHRGPNEEINEKSYELAYYYGLPNIVVTERDGLWPDNGTSYANASELLGVPSVIVEAGAMGRLDEVSVEQHLSGLYNVLKKIGVLEGTPDTIDKPTIFENMSWLYTQKQGVFYMQVKPREHVKKGDVIGILEDYFGNYIETVVSDVDGKALFLTGNPAMKEHGLVAGIGVTAVS